MIELLIIPDEPPEGLDPKAMIEIPGFTG